MDTQITDPGREGQSEPTLVIPGHQDAAPAPEPSSAPTLTTDNVSPPPTEPAEPTILTSQAVEPPPLPPAASFEAPPPPPPASAPVASGNNNRTWLIVAIVVLVLCCCCCALAIGATAVATKGFRDLSSVPWGLVSLA